MCFAARRRSHLRERDAAIIALLVVLCVQFGGALLQFVERRRQGQPSGGVGLGVALTGVPLSQRGDLLGARRDLDRHAPSLPSPGSRRLAPHHSSLPPTLLKGGEAVTPWVPRRDPQ